MKFTIDRSKWRTGRYGVSDDEVPNIGPSQLLNEDGFMCCLGFYLEACGLHRDALFTQLDPSQVLESDAAEPEQIPAWLLNAGDLDETGGKVQSSDLCNSLISDNDDDEYLLDDTRETSIANRFLEVGVDVEFVGEYPCPRCLAGSRKWSENHLEHTCDLRLKDSEED